MQRKWTIDEIKAEAAKVDWSRFDAMTDEEIRAAWAWDKDMLWPTDDELAKARVVRRGDEAGPGRPPKEAAE